MMRISCGVLFVKNKQILLAHGVYKDLWDIPKGQPEINETDFKQTAIRECREEIGFEVMADDLMPLGIKPFHENKQLALFLYTGDVYPDVNKCKCSTTYKDKVSGEHITEMDDFKYVALKDAEKYCAKELSKILTEFYEQFYGGLAA